VTALSFGTEETEDVLRKALAMTADEAALVVRDVAELLRDSVSTTENTP